MSLYASILRPLLFQMDPERAHNLALKAIASGFAKAPRYDAASLATTHFGVRFPNPIGLAAGFDKNGIAIDHWKNLGFGFVEVGTVTRHAQPGNPKPRMFRIPEAKAVINRLGFNNEGADALAERLGKGSPGIPVGINLGKSKVTELADAADDYAYSFSRLRELGDYFVVNVSSPNTPGLRELQEKGPLSKILWRLKEIDSTKPMFVKIAPDLTLGEIDDVIDVAQSLQLTGIIATNTTLSRDRLESDPKIEGGLSGGPLTSMANDVLAYIREQADPSLVLIGVGGIMNGPDAAKKLELGASLVQCYTGWIYGGPNFVTELCRYLGENKLALPR